MDINKIKDQIIFTGKVLYKENLVNATAGNISYRLKDKILITRTGSMLGYLTYEDIVEVDINPSEKDKDASRELIVHREIYKKTDATAVIHSHPVSVVALSFFLDEFIPIDSEGELFIGKVPVIDVKIPSASKELAEKVSTTLTKNNICIVKRHGSFIKAKSLKTALQLTSDLEYCAKIYSLVNKMFS